MSPRRPPRDVESLNRVLVLLSLLLAGLCVGVLGYGAWQVLGETRRGANGQPMRLALQYGVLTAVFAAVSIGCWRLSSDDGTGTWCEDCLARNAVDAPLCESCGSELPSRR
ncbi:hypothetical protein GCM10027020_23600 [Nocardioides salsibiostraticola]